MDLTNWAEEDGPDSLVYSITTITHSSHHSFHLAPPLQYQIPEFPILYLWWDLPMFWPRQPTVHSSPIMSSEKIHHSLWPSAAGSCMTFLWPAVVEHNIYTTAAALVWSALLSTHPSIRGIDWCSGQQCLQDHHHHQRKICRLRY